MTGRAAASSGPALLESQRDRDTLAQGRAIVVPYGGGGANAASFAPVVLIRPATADPVPAAPQQQRASDFGIPMTLVRPPGDEPLPPPSLPAARGQRRSSFSRYAAAIPPPAALLLPAAATAVSSSRDRRGSRSTGYRDAAFPPLTVVRPPDEPLLSGAGLPSQQDAAVASPAFSPLTVVRPPFEQQQAQRSTRASVGPPADLDDGDYSIDAYVLASLSHPPHTPSDIGVFHRSRVSQNGGVSGAASASSAGAVLAGVAPLPEPPVSTAPGRTVVRASRSAHSSDLEGSNSVSRSSNRRRP